MGNEEEGVCEESICSPSPRAIVSILVEVDRSWFVSISVSMSLTLQIMVSSFVV